MSKYCPACYHTMQSTAICFLNRTAMYPVAHRILCYLAVEVYSNLELFRHLYFHLNQFNIGILKLHVDFELLERIYIRNEEKKERRRTTTGDFLLSLQLPVQNMVCNHTPLKLSRHNTTQLPTIYEDEGHTLPGRAGNMHSGMFHQQKRNAYFRPC
ncbi:uncharacterized protein LOC124148397 [Haliotis rufescens]|uniref:uncharacterized protein LOC124148397 n=1 Tax=Haliotis rufescens TaxID=6454 RepID=UPI001EB0203A|nr:uncharacterized protein LOC124148397 [Haliotis rufescens]